MNLPWIDSTLHHHLLCWPVSVCCKYEQVDYNMLDYGSKGRFEIDGT